MVILKKIRAASLVEALTASVIIVLVFMIASLSFNNIFMNTIRADDSLLVNRQKEIIYFTRHGKLDFPFFEEKEYWLISGHKEGKRVYYEIQNKRKRNTQELIIYTD